MKLHHFITAERTDTTKKLQDLGKALVQPLVAEAAPKAKPVKPARTVEDEDGMDAAIHTMTQDQKHLHKKLAHHD